MSTDLQKATYYFQSYTEYFWQWEIDYMFDHGVIDEANDYHGGINCIAIPNGMTIAYKEQIEKVLQVLSMNDFPPFGALILTFLATNTGEVSLAIDKIFEDIKTTYEDGLVFKHVHLDEAQQFLKTLIALPRSYKKGKNRLDLFTFLFKDVKHGLSKKYADEILRCIQNKAFELNECDRQVEITMSALSKDFNSLALLHERYPTVNDLLKAWGKELIVGIDPEDAEVEKLSENPDLIQQLLEDPKTFFMGSLIKRIWSGIQLPMHYVHPGEMPLGGISDISNKGNFDNLLLSEYANDDLIFLYRVANKEALFIRRETTPEEDLRTRIFLIDTTIKSWGTPKIVSFATAFALIHHPKNEMNFQPYAIGENYTKLSFDDKLGIIEGLQITSPLLDASSAIEKFISESEDDTIEITLFTSPKTLQHAAIHRIFNLHADKFGGIITADTEGNIDVYKLKNGAKRLVKHIVLPLEELWAKPPSIRRRKTKRSSKELSTVSYPLLYGYPNGYLAHFFTTSTGYVLQKRGILYKMNSKYKGFEVEQERLHFVSGMKQTLTCTLFEGELIVCIIYENQLVFKTRDETYKFSGDYTLQSNSYIRNLLVFEDELYLITKKHYHAEPLFLKIDLDNHFISHADITSEALKDDYNTIISNYFGYFGGSVFTKIKTILITTELELMFNEKHRLVLEKDTVRYEVLKGAYTIIEEAVYVRRNEFVFQNGAEITIDKKGMLTFSHKSFDTFHICSYVDIDLGMASDTEFAGNEYFLPENSNLKIISVDKFKQKYIDPFIVNIIDS